MQTKKLGEPSHSRCAGERVEKQDINFSVSNKDYEYFTFNTQKEVFETVLLSFNYYTSTVLFVLR